ncbi:hypothetical protein [Paenibacillus melissococcoides]|uniref:hypothetical protein n=1 Tax=Paenibacillus melissococcoides TaxID=2912268 RepID=UPI0021C2C922|nr:hypothetical protein [Paenibacillus melissococcoides]
MNIERILYPFRYTVCDTSNRIAHGLRSTFNTIYKPGDCILAHLPHLARADF